MSGEAVKAALIAHGWDELKALETALAERQQAIDEVERLRDRAVCSGCGSDVPESGICDYEGDADTIRPILREHRKRVAHTFDSGPCQGAALCPACRLESALHALDSLVAERQQAIDERAELWPKYETCIERRQHLEAERDDLTVQLQQAIDALREAQHQCRENIRRAAFAPEIGTRYTEKLRLAIADECRKLEDGISVALLSLGEKPTP